MPFYEAEEMTTGNIESACERYFIPKIGKNLACDILTGEQAPSFKTVAQIPDQKVVYVRFIPADSESGDADISVTRKRKISEQSSTSRNFLPLPSKSRSSPSKLLMQSKQQLSVYKSTYFPRSSSISDMIKLGKINTETATTIVKIFRFDMELLSWSKVAVTVEFYEDKEPVGTGGFRKAFKVTSNIQNLLEQHGLWHKLARPDSLNCQLFAPWTTPAVFRIVFLHPLCPYFVIEFLPRVSHADSSVTVKQKFAMHAGSGSARLGRKLILISLYFDLISFLSRFKLILISLPLIYN